MPVKQPVGFNIPRIVVDTTSITQLQSVISDITRARAAELQSVISGAARARAAELQSVISGAAQARAAKLQAVISEAAQAMVKPYVDSVRRLNTVYAQVIRSAALSHAFKDVVAKLPDFSALADLLEERTEAALDEVERLGFPRESIEDLWPEWQILRLAHVDAQVRSATVTNSLRKLTRSDEFAEAILGELEKSTRLKRRSTIFRQALDAHRNRHYLASIPTLLPQVEGIWEDALLLKNEVAYKYSKSKLGAKRKNLHLKNRSGTYIGNLDRKLRHSSLKNHPALRGSVELLSDAIVPKRDEILHGRLVRYGQAKLSVQLLLVLFLLVREVATYESRH